MHGSDGGGAFLDIPTREGKPRTRGLTHVMDKGLNLREIEGLFDTAGEYVDIVKLGWGTSYVTNNLEKKIALYRSFGTPVVCGGTLFGRSTGSARSTTQALVGALPLLARRDLRRHARDPARGEAAAHPGVRRRFRRALRGRLQGLRRQRRPSLWVRWMREELDAGAWKVIAEGREGGTAGIYRPTGELRTGLVDEIEHSLSFHDLIWEAPTKGSQAWFVRHFGPEVNLGNIPPDEVIALETLASGSAPTR